MVHCGLYFASLHDSEILSHIMRKTACYTWSFDNTSSDVSGIQFTQWLDANLMIYFVFSWIYVFKRIILCVFTRPPLSLWHRGHQGLIMKHLQLSVLQGVYPENWGWNKSNFSFRILRESNFIQLGLVSKENAISSFRGKTTSNNRKYDIQATR